MAQRRRRGPRGGRGHSICMVLHLIWNTPHPNLHTPQSMQSRKFSVGDGTGSVGEMDLFVFGLFAADELETVLPVRGVARCRGGCGLRCDVWQACQLCIITCQSTSA